MFTLIHIICRFDLLLRYVDAASVDADTLHTVEEVVFSSCRHFAAMLISITIFACRHATISLLPLILRHAAALLLLFFALFRHCRRHFVAADAGC